MPIKKYTSKEWEHFNKSKIMHRQRLYDIINENLHCQLIGIIADSGFGKSSLMYGYLSHESKNTLWCSFNRDESLDTLLNQIISIINSDHQIEAIVFDNCSVVSNAPLFANLISDILALTPRATLFLLGSALPPLPFVVLKAKEQYFELTYNNLALDRQEVENYFNTYHNLSLRPHEIDLIYNKTQGWFISLQLIHAFLRKNYFDNLESLDLNFLSVITDINEYFSYHLFENQSPDMQNFLLESSPVIELESDVINELLMIDNSSYFLSELKGYHGFVQIGINKKMILHPLLRHFLYDRYMSYESGKCLAAHKKLIGIYEKKHNYILAFSHAVACDSYTAAIRLMTKISDRYNPLQLLNIIDGHLEEISPSLLFSNTSIFLQRCMPENLMSKLIQPLTDSLSYEYDNLKTANLQHRLGTMYYHLGNIAMAKELLEKSLANSKLLHNTEVMAFNYQLLADCYLTMGDSSQALGCARNALYLSEQNNITILQFHSLETFSRIQLSLHHVKQASDYISQAFELLPSDSYELFWLYSALSATDIANGDPDSAVNHAIIATEIVQNSICGYDISYTHLALARALISSGRTAEVNKHLTLAYKHSEFNGLLRLDILNIRLTIESDPAVLSAIRDEQLALIKKYNYTEIIKSGPIDKTMGSAVSVSEKTEKIVINTFNNFTISYNCTPITIKRSASLRLLQLLIVNRNHFITKEYIIEQLFPESSASSGNNNFNVALSVLRKSLDTTVKSIRTNESCILRESNRYQLNPNFFRIDAALFEERYKKLSKIPSDNLHSWIDLSTLFNGIFMSEYPYESFLSNERDRLTAYQKNVLLHIARIYIHEGDFSNSLTYYNHVLELDPYDEDIYYELVEMLLDNDSLVKAQSVAEKMKFHLEEEMGIPCMEQLQSMFSYYHKHSKARNESIKTNTES